MACVITIVNYDPKSFIVQATGQTGGQRYSDTSPFSIPWIDSLFPYKYQTWMLVPAKGPTVKVVCPEHQ